MVQRDIDPLNGATREDVLMSADDARKLGVGDGDPILLVSDSGEFRGRVFLAPIKPGNLEVYFPTIKQKREYGLMMLSDGRLRAISNRSENGEYSIKDGKFVATKKPTPAQQRCEPPASPNPAQSPD